MDCRIRPCAGRGVIVGKGLLRHRLGRADKTVKMYRRVAKHCLAAQRRVKPQEWGKRMSLRAFDPIPPVMGSKVSRLAAVGTKEAGSS